MEIEKAAEFEGYSVLWYLTRGHVDPEAFKAELLRQHDVDADTEGLVVEHAHLRCVPAGPEYPGIVCYHYSMPGRGAFPVTLVDLT